MNEIYGKSFISLLLALNRFRAGNCLAKGTKSGKTRFSRVLFNSKAGVVAKLF